MVPNNIKFALRHLWLNRLYSGINIVGLATGITCMLFAVLYWSDEHSFDTFHKANPHLYRITTTLTDKEGEESQTGGTGQVQGPAFKAAVPELKQYVRVFGGAIFNDIRTEDKNLKLRPLFVDPAFFEVFTFRLLHGDSKTALRDVNAVVVTESTARKFFNSTDVVGRLLQMDADPSFEKLGKPLLITGVVQDPPHNSSLQFDVLFTFDFLRLSFEDTNWLNTYLGTFVVLHPGADKHAVLKKFERVYARHAKEQVGDKNFNIYGYDPKIKYGLQPITDIHLNPLGLTGNSESGVVNGSSRVYSYLFMGIAVFVLLMAGINIINITIGSSLKRAKEVGIRKIAGGSRWQIIRHFLNESAILCVIAFLLSLVLMQALLPWFNHLSGKQLLFLEALNAKLLLYAALVLLAIIGLTGFYPAYIVSRFKASEALYNKQKLTGRHAFGRSLVVVQFSLAVFLLIGTLVYYGQMHYIRTKNLGYNPSQVIYTTVSGDRDYKTVMGFLKNELAKEPSISRVSFGTEGWKETATANNRSFNIQYKNIDEHFLSLLEIPLQAGRNLSGQFKTDTKEGALVNETFLKVSGITDPVGKRIKVHRDDSTFKTIQGVVKDFHFGSLREPIQPMVLYMMDVPGGGIWVKFETARQKEAMAALERIYKQAMPDAVYEYQFLDELNARQYIQEARWQQVISIATGISFVICCLGLFGLAHLSAHQRIKEIGIRKTLGASVSQIVTLLSGSFLKLVLIAFVIAAPVSWLVMNRWLEDFAYRIHIGPGIFLAAGAMAFVIAMLAVSVQAVKAAISNPVKSLRTE